MAIVALDHRRLAVWGLARVPTGFLPIEDQGYLLVSVQLPDGAALDRTQKALDQVSAIAGKEPGVDQVIDHRRHLGARQQRDALPMPASPMSCSRTGASATICARSFARLSRDARRRRCARHRAAAAADPGHRQCRRLHACRSSCATAVPISPSCRASPTRWSPMRNRRARCSAWRPRSAPSCRNCASTSIASRRRRCTSRSTRCSRRWRPISARPIVDQFNKFGRVFQVYAQADAPFRLRPRDIENLTVRNQQGDMIPLGTLVEDHAGGRPVADQPLQSLSVVDRHRAAGAGFSSGEAMR